MAESGQETSMSACRCVQCIQNWTYQSSALRDNTVTTNQRRSSYPMNSYTYSAALTFTGSPNHLYNQYPSGSFQTQISSYVLPSYATPIFRNTYGQMYNGTYSRPSPAREPAEIRSYTPPSSRTWASPDTFEGLHSQTTPETVALPDPNNWIYRINYFIPSETRTSTSAPQRINSTMPLNDLTVIRQTLDVISSGSTFPTQPSSMPSSNFLSSNNPPSLMSSTAPNSGSTFPTQPSSMPSSNLVSSNNPPSLMSSTAPNSGSTFPTQPLSTLSSNLVSSNNPPSLMSSTAPNSGSTFPTQPSSMPSSNLVSSNNPPSLMSSTAPNYGSTFPTQPSSMPSSNFLSSNNPPSLMSRTAPNSGSTFPTQPSSTPSSNLVSSNNSPSLMSSTAPNSGSTFPTQPSSTPSSNLVSSNNSPSLMSSTAPNTPQLSLSTNNPPSLMSSTAPNTPQLSLNMPSATVQESSIDSSNQFTLQFNNNTNEHMARVMDNTEGNSESEEEIDRNLPEVSMPEEEIIDRRKQLCPHNDKDECDDDCPYRHGRLCHLCLTHRLNPYNPELHAD
ncbi:TPRXL protein, partial [Biomphalaria glabrata]